MKVWLAATLLILAQSGQAQVTPVLRVSVNPEVVTVGEAVTLEVRVLVPTWFTSPSIYPSFELSNAITRQPPDSSYPTNERIEGETWAGIVREYRIFPMLGATYQLTDQSMTVTYADSQTRKPIKVQVDVPEISFTATVPHAMVLLTSPTTSTASGRCSRRTGSKAFMMSAVCAACEPLPTSRLRSGSGIPS